MRRRLLEGGLGAAWSLATAKQLLTRYGVVFRETAHAEGLVGGFSAVYDVLKAMEESGKVRRGYFAADLGATQFAMPAAVDLLRSLRVEREGERGEMLMLAATDPANPYGALLRWPAGGDAASFADAECGGAGGFVRWGAGGLSAAGESECAGVSCRRRSRGGGRWLGRWRSFWCGGCRGIGRTMRRVGPGC